MIRLLTDADFNKRILTGLLKREPRVDVVRAQDVGLRTANDPEILAWAAENERILLTHDANTMADHANQRVKEDRIMPGVIVVPQKMPIGLAIDDLEIIIGALDPTEWNCQVVYLPL